MNVITSHSAADAIQKGALTDQRMKGASLLVIGAPSLATEARYPAWQAPPLARKGAVKPEERLRQPDGLAYLTENARRAPTSAR